MIAVFLLPISLAIVLEKQGNTRLYNNQLSNRGKDRKLFSFPGAEERSLKILKLKNAVDEYKDKIKVFNGKFTRKQKTYKHTKALGRRFEDEYG